MKLILHIGQEKTGTTTLQHCLYQNESILNRHGICLSHTLDLPNNRALPVCFQNRKDNYFFLKGISDSEDYKAFRQSILTSFKDEVARNKNSFHTMIVTSEHLQSRVKKSTDIERLAQFLKPLVEEIVIICYFRKQSSKVPSSYSTLIQTGGTVSFEEFVRRCVSPQNREYNYFYFANKWMNSFEPNQFLAREFSRKTLVDRDINRDFFVSLGLPDVARDIVLKSKDLNPAISARAIATLRLINRIVPRFRKGRESWLHRALHKVVDNSFWARKGKKLSVYDVEPAFDDCFCESNARLFERFMKSDQNPW